jgi:pimeloyl-ACP methyl ester carboxylesterase
MSYLEVPAASLYYETVGQGPLLLCISGATGDVDVWKPLAEALKDKFTVVMYDRQSICPCTLYSAHILQGRGFSRSFLSAHDPQDYEHRLETDADDAARLIKHLSKEPAIVLGNSFGGIVALALLTLHAHVIKTLVLHEPQAVRLLPDSDKMLQRIQEIHDTYRKSGMPPAYHKLADYVKLSQGEAMGLLEATNPKNGAYNFSNAQYFWEREARAYPFHHFDVDAIKQHKDKLVLANGEQTDPEALHSRPNFVLGEKLGLKVEKFPGGHMGSLTNTKEFAEKLSRVLVA